MACGRDASFVSMTGGDTGASTARGLAGRIRGRTRVALEAGAEADQCSTDGRAQPAPGQRFMARRGTARAQGALHLGLSQRVPLPFHMLVQFRAKLTIDS